MRSVVSVSRHPVSVPCWGFTPRNFCLNRLEACFPGRSFRRKPITTSFNTLGLSAELLRAVSEQGYTETTPIQAQAIPVVLAGRDLLAAAQTGTGKTAGFTLPLLELLHKRGSSKVIRALILVPTRELAAQVQESVRVYGQYKPLRSITVFGGVNINPQIQDLRRGVDIVVATPGRLLDHVQQKTIDLRHVEILVLDEADRMLDMGFIHDIRRIIGLLPRQRQNLMFSATFPEEIRKLASSFMHNPATVEVARRNTPAELVSQVQHPVDQSRKKDLLAHLVKTNDWRQVLVFTKTKRGANRLAEALEKGGIEADAIHGNKSQPQRTRVLKRFKDNELQVLVATDIAARGIDIDELPHVVNFDLPHVAEDYVHRIGRTGRAGSSGEAVSLVCHDDRPLMAAIEKLMNRKVESRVIAGFEPGGSHQKQEPVQNQPRHQQRPQHKPHGSHNQHHQRRAENKNTPEPRPAPQPQRPHHAPAPSPVSRPTGTPAPAPRPRQSEQRRQVPALFGGQRRHTG
jgi:ATP-dependent RNA helicase RhlE